MKMKKEKDPLFWLVLGGLVLLLALGIALLAAGLRMGNTQVLLPPGAGA